MWATAARAADTGAEGVGVYREAAGGAHRVVSAVVDVVSVLMTVLASERHPDKQANIQLEFALQLHVLGDFVFEADQPEELEWVSYIIAVADD